MISHQVRLRAYTVIVSLAVLGVLCAVYILSHQGSGLASPWAKTYEIRLQFEAGDGVVAGLGQPVNVAGVDVGSIVGARLDRTGRSTVTVRIQSSKLPHVYANGTAALRPITPLDDMRIELLPGRPPARTLRPGALLDVGHTSSPAELSDLLAAFDGDTRAYLASLFDAVGRGTKGRAANMRRALVALGPTVADVRRITSVMAERRRALARLTHNLAEVTRAASQDDRLSSVVASGNETLRAVALADTPLRQAVAQLPPTLRSVRTALTNVATFSDQLRPTTAALLEPVRDLPATLDALRPFAQKTANVLKDDVRPFVRRAVPVVRDLGTATPALARLAPHMASAFQGLTYLFNVLAYNPRADTNGAPDEGGLFWLSWFAHNWNSGFSLGDAHGALGHASFTYHCLGATSPIDSAVRSVVSAAVGLSAVCPK